MHQRTKVCHGVALALATVLAGSARAQDITDIQRVEVTGSSIKRIAAEGALPQTYGLRVQQLAELMNFFRMRASEGSKT